MQVINWIMTNPGAVAGIGIFMALAGLAIWCSLQDAEGASSNDENAPSNGGQF